MSQAATPHYRYHLTPALEASLPTGGYPRCYLGGGNPDLPTLFTDKETEAGGGPGKNYGTGCSDHQARDYERRKTGQEHQARLKE